MLILKNRNQFRNLNSKSYNKNYQISSTHIVHMKSFNFSVASNPGIVFMLFFFIQDFSFYMFQVSMKYNRKYKRV